MLLFSSLVAGSFSLGAMAAPLIAPEIVTVLRFAVAACILGVICWLRGDFQRHPPTALWRYLVLGGIFSSYFVLMFEGLKTAPPVSAAAVFTLTPIVTAGFSFLILRQVTTLRIALALAVGATGALWVIFRADLDAFLAFRIGSGEVIYFWGATGLGQPAADCVDHDWLRGFCSNGCDLRVDAICVPASARGKGYGLYLSGAKLGDLLGNRTGQWRSAGLGSGGCRLDDLGLVGSVETRRDRRDAWPITQS